MLHSFRQINHMVLLSLFIFERCFTATHEYTADTSREVPFKKMHLFIARDRTHWSDLANSKELSHFICTLHSRLRNS